MEETIASLSKSLGGFCNHLESSCNALTESVARRPIPLDSASSTFIQSLNRRVSNASSDLNLLESLSFGTVSLEELLGHCNEAYKSNQNRLLHLQDRFMAFGYLPDVSIDEENDDSGESTPDSLEPNYGPEPPSAYATSIINSLEEDTLMDESLSLKSMGLSDLCLATLASEAEVEEKPNDAERKLIDDPRPIIEVSRNDYDNLPSYIKNLTSWEELLAAVEKINSSLMKKEKASIYFFHQDEITSMDLGPKARSYLLLLTRMNQLVVEAVDGQVSSFMLRLKNGSRLFISSVREKPGPWDNSR